MKNLKAFAITFYVVTVVITMLILASLCINNVVEFMRGFV